MLGVVDGVGDEVAQDAFDATLVDFGDHRFGGQVDDEVAARVLPPRIEEVVEVAPAEGAEEEGGEAAEGEAAEGSGEADSTEG